MDKFEVLKHYFGYDSFREGQEESVDAILNKRDLLTILSTGAGKSLCYQIPAIMSENLTIIFSPLISLMKDQVDKLVSKNIESYVLNSTLSKTETENVFKSLEEGRCKILYTSPERLDNEEFVERIKNIKIDNIIIDEAHCISQWGNDFRPAFLKIVEFINNMEERPTIAAFTATATLQVREDIITKLSLDNPVRVISTFDRLNLTFAKYDCNGENKVDILLMYLKVLRNKAGIVYCNTRKGVDELYEKLKEMEISVGKYHAGMRNSDRELMQTKYISNNIRVMIATNAFGMGIDKANIQFVIHFNTPFDIESYYQEAGRAGRNGDKSLCVLLFDDKDFNLASNLIRRTYNFNKFEYGAKQAMDIKLEKLESMMKYTESNECLRNDLLEYFSEIKEEDCGKCSHCLKKGK